MDRAHSYWQLAIADRLPLLVIAAFVVGIAIGIDGDARRFVNGIGGLLWIVAAGQVVLGTIAAGINRRQVALVLAVILVLSYLIRPSDPAWAAIGFGWGGVLVGYYGRELGSRLGAMLGALWLPAHLLIAIGRGVVRELRDQPTSLRGDPPPTAILVPLIMVAAAWIFAVMASEWRAARADGRLLVPRNPIRSR